MPAINGVFRQTQEEFHKHMKDKIQYWKPERLWLGDDFAVWQFEYGYQLDSVRAGIGHWAESYNYNCESDLKLKLVIINKTGA